MQEIDGKQNEANCSDLEDLSFFNGTGREGLIRGGHLSKALEAMKEQVCGFLVEEHSS